MVYRWATLTYCHATGACMCKSALSRVPEIAEHQRWRSAGRVAECLLLHLIAGPLLGCSYPYMAMQACSPLVSCQCTLAQVWT